jgi:hypothetical protein
MSGGLFETHQREDCETHLLQTIKAEVQKLWDRTVVYFNEARKAETRRHPDTHEELDYEARLRELEGYRDEPRLRMGNYHEGGRDPSWQKWVMTIVQMLIVAGIGGVIYELEELKSTMAASMARQEMDERRIDRIESRVYRGSP